MRLRLEADGSVAEVDEDSVQRVRPLRGLARGWEPRQKHRARGRMRPWKPPSRSRDGEGAVPVATRTVAPVAGCSLMALAPSLQSNPPGLDLAEDLASLISLNECSALNTLRQRLRAQLPYTYAGPSLLALGGGHNAASRAAKVRGGPRGSASLGEAVMGGGHRPPPGMVVEEPGAPVPAEGTVAPPQPRGWGAAGGVRGWGSSGGVWGRGYAAASPEALPAARSKALPRCHCSQEQVRARCLQCTGSPRGVLHPGGRNHRPPM